MQALFPRHPEPMTDYTRLKATFHGFQAVSLAHTPTPLEPLRNLSRYLGGPNIYIKRDDCTGLATGGNKARKLEFLMGDALAKNADTIVTIGAIQSNHVRQTAAAAARLGLKCEVILTDSVPDRSESYRKNGNFLVDHILGAQIVQVSRDCSSTDAINTVMRRLSDAEGNPYYVPAGGSNPVGCLGYAKAAVELLEQAHDQRLRIDTVIHGTGSGGTQAGLLWGFALAQADILVLGISVSRHSDSQAQLVKQLLAETIDCSLLPRVQISKNAVQVNGNYVGPGYGQPTPEMREAVKTLARLEGILLDPVYTGKAMAGLFDLIRRKHFSSGQNIVFLHTGGSTGLFGYAEDFHDDK